MAKTIGSVIALMNALGLFSGPSWTAWPAVLKAIFALPMSEADLDIYRRVTGRTTAPTKPFREVWLIVGRRGGKSFVTSLIAVFLTTCRRYKLSPGEVGTFMVLAADRKQARVIKGYVAGMLRACGALSALVASETSEQIDLKNGLRIEIATASFRSLRGYIFLRPRSCSRPLNAEIVERCNSLEGKQTDRTLCGVCVVVIYD